MTVIFVVLAIVVLIVVGILAQRELAHRRELRIRDNEYNTAVTLCMDNDVPILVFNLLIPGNIERVILGEEIGTLVGAAR